jgi:hypothetical protein
MSCLSIDCPAASAAETQLLSITGVHLQPLITASRSTGQYMSGFDIRTWGVRVLAVCHIPGGWTISAGKNANPEGELYGSAGEGAAFLDSGNLHQLTDLFLVQVDDYHPSDTGNCAKSCTPASFSGNFYIGEYGINAEDEPIPRRVLPTNIRLSPAARCPDPQ